MTTFSKQDKNLEAAPISYLNNDEVHTFSWSDINVSVKDRKTGRPLDILHECNGLVQAGQVIALMGPSGSGKTTLLNVLANRSQSKWEGRILANGHPISPSSLRQISSYVEQEDALIGSLTVKETIEFAGRLSAPKLEKRTRLDLIDSLIESFGLRNQENTIIGTPLRKGVSGGQKRRVSVASQLVSSPKVLFLDEPTSGLDSAASYEVMKFISDLAKQYRLIVIASIHQPSTLTFSLFDSLLLLSRGKTCYFGPTSNVSSYFHDISPVPPHTDPAEYLLDLVNTDFNRTDSASMSAQTDIATIFDHWTTSKDVQSLKRQLGTSNAEVISTAPASAYSNLAVPWILLHRNWIKSRRDFLAYGTRIAMYSGLAVMMGTVWLRLPYTQSSIQPFINALFFSGAFMSFMAVAYVPSVIEDLHNFKKEHGNGLYGPLPFIIANFLIGIPWLLLITIIFSAITYWLCNFRQGPDGFFLWVLWLFLDLLAAESLVVLLSAIFPIFVVALAATAFANGLWMSVGGFLVPMGTLNVFWRYVFHYIDYQAYVFQAMMLNQFRKTTYDCEKTSDGYYCMYSSDLKEQGKIRGVAVLDAYDYSYADGKLWEWFGILLAIIMVYRVFAYLVLVSKTRK